MQAQEIELSIGECLQVGEHTITVLDIEGGEVSFRVDHEENFQQLCIGGFQEVLLPR